jgi:hypothetical protein
MVVVGVLSVSNITGTTATAASNNNKRRVNVIQQKGEHDRHFLGCRFSVMFSFSIVLSWRRSPMLNRDDLKSSRV